MKPCRKRPPAAPIPQTAPSPQNPPGKPAAMRDAGVRRYVHPIRTARQAPRGPVEEQLSYVLEALARQSEQLDEILNRLAGDNSDTM